MSDKKEDDCGGAAAAVKRIRRDSESGTVVRNEMDSPPSAEDVPLQDSSEDSDTRINSLASLMLEVGDIILNFVENGESVHNVLQTFAPLRATFGSKIPLWYFDKVLPHLLPYLTAKDVRKCTRVCKTWRSVVFKFVEDHPSRRPYNEMEGNTVGRSAMPWPLENLTARFLSVESISNFLRISPNHSNPFIGRSVSLNGNRWHINKADFGQFTSHVIMLLQEYGEHIWYLQIGSDIGLESPRDFFRRLTLILPLLPNLRALNVAATELTESLTSQFRDPSFVVYAPNGPHLYSSEIDPAWQLPPLHKLESLTLECSGYGGPVFVALLRKYLTGQLRFLSLPIDSSNMGNPQVLSQFGFGGLTELHIVKVRTLSYDGPDYLQNFMSQLSPRSLQKLKFYGHGDAVGDRLFVNLRGFELRVLELESPPYQLGEYCNNNCRRFRSCTTWDEVALSLPNLHTIRMKHNLMTSFKFLARIPSLRNLKITEESFGKREEFERLMRRKRCYFSKETPSYGCHHSDIGEEIHKWVSGDPELDRSLLSNLLPGLETLQVSYVLSCFRERDAGSGTIIRNKHYRMTRPK